MINLDRKTYQKSFKIPNLIIVILLSFFAISYFSELRAIKTYSQFIPLLVFLLCIEYIFLRNKIKVPNLIKTYILLLGIGIFIPSSIALDPVYSCTRVVITIILLYISLIVFAYLQNLIKKQKWQNLMLWSLLLTLLAIIAIRFIFPELNQIKLRLEGGTNENTVGIIGLFSTFFCHYTALQNKRWTNLIKIVFLLGITTLFWSLSRGNIISFFILYTVYFGIITFISIVTKFKFSTSKTIILLIIAPFLIFLLFLFLNTFLESDLFDLIVERRISNATAIQERYNTWTILWSYFEDNYWFGSLGWWNASRILEELPYETYLETAAAPHNSYFRLLSEVGLVGFAVVIIAPVYISLKMIFRIIKSLKIISMDELKIAGLLLGMLLALFAQQFVYDSYLVGIADTRNSIIIFVMVLNYQTFARPKNKILFSSFKDKKNI
jgi:O-antigen ligase